MNSPPVRGLSVFRLRSLFLATAFAAVLLGWRQTYRTVLERESELRSLSNRMRALESSFADLYVRPVPHHRDNAATRLRMFSGRTLDGCDLSGMTIHSSNPEFQSVTLDGANLEGADISVGSSSFQRACFDHARLQNATLAASGAAFQYVTFVGADLRGAKLTAGTGADFQVVSFRDANLTGAKIVCSGSSAFSAVDVDNAQFQAADLSSIDDDNLESSYFSKPPTYDRLTKFPPGFDPKRAGWRLVEAKT